MLKSFLNWGDKDVSFGDFIGMAFVSHQDRADVKEG